MKETKLQKGKVHPLEAIAEGLTDFYHPMDELVYALDDNIRKAIVPNEADHFAKLDEYLKIVKRLGPDGEHLAHEIDKIATGLQCAATRVSAAVTGVFFLKLTGHSVEQIRQIGSLAGLARNFKGEPEHDPEIDTAFNIVDG